MNIQTITLDISKRSAVTPVLYLRQGDKSGTQLRVNVMRDGAAFPLGGYGVRFEMRAPKDRGYYECTGTANGNVATFTIDETYAAAFAGVTDVAYVRILEGSTVIASTGNFRVVIHEDGTEGADPNGAYTNGVTKWLANAQQSLMNMENSANAEVDAAIERLDDAVADVDGAVSRANAAAAAAEGVVVDAVPLMSKTVHGGAKLGHGLRVSAGALGVQLVESGSGTATVQADGDYLHALEVDGVSEQRTTTGKNLLKPNPNYMSYADDTFVNTNTDSRTTMFLNCYTYDASGGQVSYVSTNISSPGKYSLEMTVSTTTARAYVKHNGGTRDLMLVKSDTPCVLQPGTYTISLEVLSADPTTIGGLVIKNLQLEAGSTATAYEPYTGGKASPSPDYPQEVRTVKGINLLDPSTFLTPTGGPDSIDSDGYVTDSSYATDARYWGYDSRNFEARLSAGTYVLTADIAIVSTSQSSGFRLFTSDNTLILDNPTPALSGFDSKGLHSFVFTLLADTTVGLVVKSYDAKVRFQIERGTTAHDFVPYGALGLKVTGKNLARPKNVADVLDSGLLWTYLGDGKWRAFGAYKGSASGSYSGGSTLSYNLGVLPAGMYTASSFKLRGTGNHLVRVAQNNSYKTASAITSDKVSSATFTADGTSTYYAAIGTDKNSIDGVFGLMIEAGSTATEYAPYVDGVTPIPLNGNVLASMPDGTHDELAIDDAGHAVIDKRVGIKTFDGSESWSLSGSARRVDHTMSQQDAAVTIDNGTIPNALCDHYIAKTANDTYSDEGAYYKGPCFNVLGAYVFFSNGEGNNMVLDTWKTWLASNPVTVFYQLATPQTIDLGYIDMPKLSEGSTIELLASIDPPIEAEWWAVGAGAVHESIMQQAGRIAALESAIAELATS